jgi:hypothetical protein
MSSHLIISHLIVSHLISSYLISSYIISSYLIRAASHCSLKAGYYLSDMSEPGRGNTWVRSRRAPAVAIATPSRLLGYPSNAPVGRWERARGRL